MWKVEDYSECCTGKAVFCKFWKKSECILNISRVSVLNIATLLQHFVLQSGLLWFVTICSPVHIHGLNIFNGFPNEASQLKLIAAIGRESQCVLLQYRDTSLHRGSQSAEKHPTVSMFTCSKTSPCLFHSVKLKWFLPISFCYLLIPIQVYTVGVLEL